jgi:GTP cyclohydrolase I
MVVIEAQHLCMQMRGVEKQGSTTITSDYSGVFQTDKELRQEILNSIFTHS